MDVKVEKRSYSLDLLRIICMIMIIALHFISHGGLSDFFAKNSIMHHMIVLLRAFSICAVNVFVLISGYFMIQKNGINVKRIISIFLAILFYSWIILLLSQSFHWVHLDFKALLTSVFPVSYRLYWFPTCYLFLCLVSPFLNKLLNALSPKAYRLLLAILFLCFSVGNEILAMSDPFSVSGGYSIVWFVFLYCVAGYIKIHGLRFNLSKHGWLVVYLLSAVLIFAVVTILSLLSDKIPIIAKYGLETHFARYCSVLVTIESLSLFLYFRSLNIKNVFSKKIIGFFAPLAFGVYLIHDNANIRNYLYTEVLKLDQIPQDVISLPILLGLICLVFLACAMIEFFRLKVFGLFEKSKWYNKAINKLQLKLESLLTDN